MKKINHYILLFGIFILSSSVLAVVGKSHALDSEMNSQRENSQDRYKLAQYYIEKKDYEAAVRLYSLLLKDYPGNRHIYYLRGILYHSLDQIKKAKADYQYLIESDSADEIIFNNMGVIYAAEEDYKIAQKWFMRAVSENPKLVEAHDNLAVLYTQTKKYDRAIDAYSQVVELEDDNIEALYNLGVNYVNIGDYVQAEKQWKKVLTINPNNFEIKKILEELVKHRRTLSLGDNQKGL